MQVVINMDSRFLRRVAIGASLALAVAIIVIPAATDAGSVQGCAAASISWGSYCCARGSSSCCFPACRRRD